MRAGGLLYDAVREWLDGTSYPPDTGLTAFTPDGAGVTASTLTAPRPGRGRSVLDIARVMRNGRPRVGRAEEQG